MTPEQRTLWLLSRIDMSLESIASTLGRKFPPFGDQKAVSMSEEMEEQWKEQKEERRKDDEIEELKKSNIINTKTARIAVFGLLATVLLGIFQLILNWVEYKKPQKPPVVNVQVASPTPEILYPPSNAPK